MPLEFVVGLLYGVQYGGPSRRCWRVADKETAGVAGVAGRLC